MRPSWAYYVGIMGCYISAYLKNTIGLEVYIGLLNKNFDPSIISCDLEWILNYWKDPMLIKEILDL
ncbi:hypothetical protein A6J40_17875 [Legionella longbeachae]|nr:hypothetical protein A6J40_17875 [Legionella longbeachae]VEE03165.1 L-lactate dehydrogenase [cytochrome] [Legionella oakridgensis]